MPIDTSKSHSAIVKELLDEYKSKGKIGATTPKNIEHAVRIANAIAYKAKEESALIKMMEFNREHSVQLSLDVRKNVETYLNSIIKQNENELAQMVRDFVSIYSSLESKRLRSFGVAQSYKLKTVYSVSNLVFSEMEGKKVPIGYRQNLGHVTQSVAEKALKHSNHFFSKVEDSTLFIEITASYLAEIQLALKDLSA